MPIPKIWNLYKYFSNILLKFLVIFFLQIFWIQEQLSIFKEQISLAASLHINYHEETIQVKNKSHHVNSSCIRKEEEDKKGYSGKLFQPVRKGDY